ncbi:hypothetical protein ACJMK2_028091 [Sinanodonta woodiana]|uniref:Inactive STAND domain-containing protein n=1 Tax=Sinanodonta woodiana TaxID=1069815 RepID=A0ABD3X608_SINWO
MSLVKLSKNHYYGCVGREENKRELQEVWQKGNKRIFNCHGGKESGKSCFIRKIMDEFIENDKSNYIVIDMDFKMGRIRPKDSVKFWKNLANKLKQRVKVEVEISDPMMEDSLESFFEKIQEKMQEMDSIIIFLFDNLDYARNAKADDTSSTTEKDLFSELQDNFIPGIVERTDLSRVFITSTVQLRYGRIAPVEHKIKMDPLSTESAEELLLTAIELISNKEMDRNAARDYLGPYLRPIALLSEGIPMAIIVTATQLTENNRFIKPKEMLTVLIFSRMYTLSPEFFPKDDNMIKTYGEYIDQQSSGMKERLQDMGKTDSSSFTVENLRLQLADKDGNLAFFKMKTVTPLLLRNFVKYVGNSDKSEVLEMPGFLRDCLIIEKIIDSSKGLGDEDRFACRNVVRDCLLRLGKNFDEEKVKRIIQNPQAYDEFVDQILGNLTQEEDTCMDTQKEMEKNALGKPFTGYSEESLLGHKQESNLSDLPEQRMQNLKLSEEDADLDSHNSLNPGTPDEEIYQREQTQVQILPGQLHEQVIRFNHNLSVMPQSIERSPQSIAHAGFIYQANGIFKCQYCGAQIHRSDITSDVVLIQKHQEINPRCSFARQYLQEYPEENFSQKVEDKRALNIRKESETSKGEGKRALTERKERETTKGGVWAPASSASHASKNNEEETEQEFLHFGVTENGQGTNGIDTKNDKFNNSSNLSSSYGDKQYPLNKIAPSVMEDHTGPNATENEDGFSPRSFIELNNVRDQCTKQTDENGAKRNDLFETDAMTERKRLYVEHKVNRTSKDDEGYVSPHNSDSDDQGSPDPGVVKNP